MAGNAGRSAPDPTFLEDFTPLYYQNLNIKYGYVRMRANGTVLVTDVSTLPLLPIRPPFRPVLTPHALLPGYHACMPQMQNWGGRRAKIRSDLRCRPSRHPPASSLTP